ncbi:hypothetical protein ACHAXS_010320 [Conticribra weissflogii]
MIASFRLWLSLVAMFVGSAMLTWYQSMINHYNSYSPQLREEWMPLEQAQSEFTSTEESEDRSEVYDGGENAPLQGTFADREAVDGSIESISLLGERNSGTRWIYAHLGLCFNDTIPVHRTLSRYKHWFQYDNPSKIAKNTLVIAMFRDPIQWTWAMNAVPHHASRHIDLTWKEFVTKEWTMERLFKDEAWRDEQFAKNNTGRICQENFHYHEIVSCLTRPYPEGFWGDHRRHRFSQHQPFYEMKVNDPKGTPYANILEMRAGKIRNFLETAQYSNVEGFWYYRYEDLLKQGTEDLVTRIERATGVKRNQEKCKIFEPQNRRKRSMDPAYFDYMVDHVDWEAENLIGYDKPKYRATDVAKAN